MAQSRPLDLRAGRSRPSTERDQRRAVVVDRYGPVSDLEVRRVEVPEPGPGEVLVRVGAAAISPGDRALVTGVPRVNRLAGGGLRRPRSTIPGFDVAGTVERIGAGVTDVGVGDRVFGIAHGALTEVALASADLLAPIPEGWSFDAAAAVPESGCVALQIVRERAPLAPGDHVAVIGAGGGVGTYVVQLAVASGAVVTGVCRAAMAEAVAALGVDDVVDHHRRRLRDLDRRFRVVVDTAGVTPLRQLVPAVEPGGLLLLVGADHRRRLTGGLGRWARALAWSPVSRRRLRPFVAGPLTRERLDDLAALMATGAIRPAVDRTYPVAEVAAAFEHLDHRTRPGKTVVVMTPTGDDHARTPEER